MKNRYIPAFIILFVLLPAVLLRLYQGGLQPDHTTSVSSIERAFADEVSE